MIRIPLTWLMSPALGSFIYSITFAHEGHGHAGEGATAKHYLTEPVHLLQLSSVAVVVIACGWVAVRWYHSKQIQRENPATKSD